MDIFLKIAAFVLVLTAIVGCQAWKWSECRGVGHSMAYCALYGK